MEGDGDKESGTYTVLQTGQQQRYQFEWTLYNFQNWTPWHITSLNIILFYFIHIMTGIPSASCLSFFLSLKSKGRLSDIEADWEVGGMITVTV